MATNIQPLRKVSVYLKPVRRYYDVVKAKKKKSTKSDTTMINNNKTMDKYKS